MPYIHITIASQKFFYFFEILFKELCFAENASKHKPKDFRDMVKI